ncbi:uncharacterized protein N7483_010388 [Penicillium malachiteum]|uniref:uncharacterized protein n=1 Tax=Penicillium malachiteum TaxID=1324776 RepID=UPI002547D472|nr:uncharacterized protein N7483_010388 [Penicillium malachiteum]KAJ5713207.1 hypothetical protein N7483_010388 [Penicillium malachiteum]
MSEDPYARPSTDYPFEIQINPLKQTRVVDIQPGYGSQEIRCTLSVKNLQTECPSDYEALSYVWGKWEDCATISLNGIPDFPVTRNLENALQRLRHRERTRRMWIDQLCIQQECDCQNGGHTCEKKQQIKNIGQIFSQAQQVIIWFGEHD